MQNTPLNDETKAQARQLYRTVRLLKSRMCQCFEARERCQEAPGHRSDITFAQFNVLLAIEERGEVSLKELADVLHVSPPSASSMVDRLVEMGIVVREQSVIDRREVRIRLSGDSVVRFEAMEAEILQYIADLLGKLGPRHAAQWCEVYARIHEIVELEHPLTVGQDGKRHAVG